MGKKNDRGKKEQRCLDIAKACFNQLDNISPNIQPAIDILMTVKENPNNNSFPDFVCDNGFIEHFEITSSKTTNNGSTMKQEEAVFEKSDMTHIVYSPHSHDDFVISFKKIWNKHIRSFNKHNGNKNVGIFMVEYQDSSMIVDAKESQLYNRTKPRFPQDVVYMISKDVKLLNYIIGYKNQIHYVIFVHENWMFQEVFCEIIEVSNIQNILDNMKDTYVFTCNQFEGIKIEHMEF